MAATRQLLRRRPPTPVYLRGEDHRPELNTRLVPDTEARIEGDKIIAYVTDCGGIEVGWDMCGQCGQHVRRCTCRSGPQPGRGLIKVYRAANGLVYGPELPGGGPQIGLVHDADMQPAKMISDSPVARMTASAGDPEPDDEADDEDRTDAGESDAGESAAVVTPLRRRRPVANPVPKIVVEPSVAEPRLVRRRPVRRRG